MMNDQYDEAIRAIEARHPEIDEIAKKAHDAFWNSASDETMIVTFEETSQKLRYAWHEAALAVIKAVTTTNN